MSETLLQSIRDEFAQFSVYKEQYDYLCGSPLVKKLIKEISILEKQNRKMMLFVLESKNNNSSQIHYRKSGSKLVPLRKKPAQTKKYCETQTQTHAELSNSREPLKRPLIYIKEEPTTNKPMTIERLENRTKAISQPVDIVNDTLNDEPVLNNNIKVEVLDKIIQEPVEETTEEEPVEKTTKEEPVEETTEEEVVEETVEEPLEETAEEVVVEETEEVVVEETEEDVVEEPLEETTEKEVVEEPVGEETEEEVVEETTEEVAEEEEGEEVFAVVINGIEYYTTDETNGVIFNEDLSIEIGKFENKVAKFYK